MSTTGAKKAVSEWVSKAEAEKMLGISERQLERRANQGYLEKMLGERNASQNRAPVFYLRADVEALKAGKPNMHAVSTAATVDKPNLQQSAATSKALAVIPQTGSRPDPLQALALMLANVGGAAPAPSVGRWLSVDEAAKRSGLPRYYLLREARAGAKWACNVGTQKAPRWRISAEGLLK